MSTFNNVRKRLNGCRPFAWYLKRFKVVYEDAGLIPPEIFMIREETVTCTCMHTHSRSACMYVCVHVCMYVCMHACIVYIHIYIHAYWHMYTYMHIDTQSSAHAPKEDQSGLCLRFMGGAGTSGSGSEGVRPGGGSHTNEPWTQLVNGSAYTHKYAYIYVYVCMHIYLSYIYIHVYIYVCI